MSWLAKGRFAQYLFFGAILFLLGWVLFVGGIYALYDAGPIVNIVADWGFFRLSLIPQLLDGLLPTQLEGTLTNSAWAAFAVGLGALFLESGGLFAVMEKTPIAARFASRNRVIVAWFVFELSRFLFSLVALHNGWIYGFE